VVDTLASEYGWTAEYILERVYPVQVFSLFPVIAKRQLNMFIDQLEIQVLTKTDLPQKDRTNWLQQIDRMRVGGEATPPERPFDRAGLEKLRDVMGKRKKGRGPQRVQ
jgi:hypothetical protein